MRVLVCDDEPSIRLLFRGEFERAGAEVVEASDGDECLIVAESTLPDLVVLDLFMPRRDGLSTLPELRRRLPGRPVLVVSAHAAVDILEQTRSRGATACFDKLGFVDRIPALMERFATTA